jgi:chromosome segregation ATPase
VILALVVLTLVAAAQSTFAYRMWRAVKSLDAGTAARVADYRAERAEDLRALDAWVAQHGEQHGHELTAVAAEREQHDAERRAVTADLDNLAKQIDAVASGIISTDARLDESVASALADVARLDAADVDLHAQVSGVAGRTDSLNVGLKGAGSEIDNLVLRLEERRAETRALVLQTDTELRRTIAALHDALAAVQGGLDYRKQVDADTKGALAATQARIVALRQDIDSRSEKVSSEVAEQIARFDPRFETLRNEVLARQEGAVAELRASIAAIQPAVDAQRIAALEAQINGILAEVAQTVESVKGGTPEAVDAALSRLASESVAYAEQRAHMAAARGGAAVKWRGQDKLDAARSYAREVAKKAGLPSDTLDLKIEAVLGAART